jgi:hypothetical protein
MDEVVVASGAGFWGRGRNAAHPLASPLTPSPAARFAIITVIVAHVQDVPGAAGARVGDCHEFPDGGGGGGRGWGAIGGSGRDDRHATRACG